MLSLYYLNRKIHHQLRYALFTILLLVAFFANAQNIKVGVYPNPPLISIDDQGEVSGFCIDIIKHIADKKGWELEYHKYDFSSALIALERGEIDVLPALAYSAHRDTTFILNDTKVTTNWAKLYKNEDDDFIYASLEQLQNKSIAVLKDDYYLQNGENGLIDLLQKLDIEASIVMLSTYKEVIDKLSKKEVDLGLVSRYYGTLETEDEDVVRTPLNIAYVSVRFGFNRNEFNVKLVDEFDQQLQAIINNRSSIYYASEKKYFSYTPQAFIPQWLWQAFGIVLAGLTVFAIFALLLQYQVKKRTLQLKETNRLLGKSERKARLAVQTIETSRDIGFWFQAGKPFIRVNQAAITLTGFSEEELLRMVPRDLLATTNNEEYYDRLRDGEWGGHVVFEESFKTKKGGVFPVELSLAQFELDGQTYICGFARDITKRVKAERQIMATVLSTEDKERSRISKELHDSVGQTLSAISLNLESLTKIKDLSEADKDKIKNIEKLLQEAIMESRSISHNLMPPALTDLGFTFAVENLLNSFEGLGKTKFSFHSNESDVPVPKEIEFALFRITQEASNNIIKYADAREATIQYLIYDDLISLSIEDDGSGFDIKIANKNHNFGLNSMRNRAASLGGELTIDTAPGKGTGIHVSIPLT